ncbi:MAG: NAD-dependent protein deacylase [Candidatus Heimdallarchaeota archaeon]|nr:NAD-dependent protein deacylase [Candidatus Heimdallarchaeota archaeon]
MNVEQDIKIVALSGSGISKGSGIPTFRGEDGLWKNYNAMDLATPQAFAKDPELVWEWYSWRINLILDKEPNPAHYALVKLQEAGLNKWVITQNVDDLHRRAGSKNILQVHGDILHTWCQKCGESIRLKEAPKEPPRCDCGNLLRPGVIWFGESLDYKILAKAEDLLTHSCDVLLVIGTSGIVYPVAGFPMLAKNNGAIVLDFNVNETPISQIADVVVLGKAEDCLPKFVEGILSG